MAKTEKQTYFIGANTAKGFLSYADEIFGGLERLYLIKGGPGTGKSTVMKWVAEAAETKGLSVERYRCSSDSDSLDGVVLPGLSVGIADATAPHVIEPRYPGLREELVDLGAYWDREALAARRKEILTLIDGKAALYAAVYKYLGVLPTLRGERNRILGACLDGDKLDRAAGRLVRRLGTGGGFRLLSRQISALGMNGRTVLESYEEEATERWQIADSRGLRGFLLQSLLREAEKASLGVWVSRDVTLEPEALFLPEKGIAVTDGGDAAEAHRILNTERFLRREVLAEQRGRLRFLRKLEGEIVSRVTDLFGEIRERHMTLEGLYGEAMHFDGVAERAGALIRELGL